MSHSVKRAKSKNEQFRMAVPPDIRPLVGKVEWTADSQHTWPIAPNIIDQDFTATAPNQKWRVDISYVWTRQESL